MLFIFQDTTDSLSTDPDVMEYLSGGIQLKCFECSLNYVNVCIRITAMLKHKNTKKLKINNYFPKLYTYCFILINTSEFCIF